MSQPQPLRLGMFVMPIHDPAKPLAQCIDEDLELAVQCEGLGFHDFWVGEHHSSSVENIVMPELFLAKLLGLTQGIRIGPAPVCLQYHHPAHVAGRLAFLDHLSHGRLNVCFGPGAIPTDMEVFGAQASESGARVAESIDMILRLWTGELPIDIEGRFWNLKMKDNMHPKFGVGHLHKPLQQPHPPIYVPSISRASAGLSKAAERGFRFISHHMIHRRALREQWNTYSSAATAAGRAAQPADWAVSRNVFVADSTKEAQRLAKSNSLGASIQYILDLTRATAPGGVAMWKRDREQADSDCTLDYFMEDVVIAGDPDHVNERLLALREEIGNFGTLVLTAHDWDDRARWTESLRLFASEVAPAFNKAIGAGTDVLRAEAQIEGNRS
jgi:alkanesulfonate monooxygenase SsuD/methylene tetrahydromethanopterin reductase-like flavin-dependent oxidoreductase (luciferase family)